MKTIFSEFRKTSRGRCCKAITKVLTYIEDRAGWMKSFLYQPSSASLGPLKVSFSRSASRKTDKSNLVTNKTSEIDDAHRFTHDSRVVFASPTPTALVPRIRNEHLKFLDWNDVADLNLIEIVSLNQEYARRQSVCGSDVAQSKDATAIIVNGCHRYVERTR